MKKYAVVAILSLAVTVDIFALSEAPPPAEKVLKNAKDYRSMIPVKKIRKIKLPKGYHEGLLIDGDEIWVNNGMGGRTWIVDLHSGRLISEIVPVATFSEGISAAPGKRYWITDWTAKKLYRVKIKERKMVPDFEMSLEPSRPTGVIWNGKYLYVLTWTRGVLGTRYHLLKLDEEGNVLDKFRIEDISEPSQMAWDGEHIWISSWFDRRVYKVHVETSEIRGYFRSNVKALTGIAWDGKAFWVTGTKADLYHIECVRESEG